MKNSLRHIPRGLALGCVGLFLAPALSAQALGPITQQAYVKASNAGTNDRFGFSVSASGNTVVLGSTGEASTATGVDGDETNNGASQAGAAYVFGRGGASWTQLAYLKASNSQAGDQFGWAVAVDGDTIAVGASLEDSAATGIDGDQGDNSAQQSGAVYVFVRSGSTWVQQAYLKASNAGTNDFFGYSVAVSGDTIVVGASREASNATGIDGDQTDDSAADAGAVYVFVRTGSLWQQQAYIKASNSEAGDRFGLTVSVSGDTILVGAPSEDSAATGIGGDSTDNSALKSGAVYAFSRIGSIWSQQAYIKASNSGSNDQFGWSASLDGNWAVVSALFESSNALGVDGDQSSNSASGAGAAYVFQEIGGVWSQQAYLKASNTNAGDRFGISVAMQGDKILIGAENEDSQAVGVNGDRFNNSATQSGAAYLFTKVATTWRQHAYLKASNTGPSDFSGHSVALTDATAAFGANFEDSNSMGVNGPQDNNDAMNSGAAYFFDLQADVGTFCEPGNINSTGQPGSISMLGSLIAQDNLFTLRAEGLPANQFGYFINSQGANYVPNPGGSQGVLCLGGGRAIGRHVTGLQSSGNAGVIETTLDLLDFPTPFAPTVVVAGETWNFQCWHRDTNPGSTSNFTNALAVRFQ